MAFLALSWRSAAARSASRCLGRARGPLPPEPRTTTTKKRHASPLRTERLGAEYKGDAKSAALLGL